MAKENDARLNLRLTSRDLETWKRIAKAHGLSVSAWVRMSAKENAQRCIDLAREKARR